MDHYEDPWETSIVADYEKSWTREIDNSLGDKESCDAIVR